MSEHAGLSDPFWTDEAGQKQSLTIADGPCLIERGGYGTVPTGERATRIAVTEWRYPVWPDAVP